MAGVTRRPNGHRWVTFKAPNGKRQTIRLGPADEQQARNFAAKIDKLLVCKKLGELPDARLMEWLAELDDDIHDTLSKCWLVPARGASTVGALTSWIVTRCKKLVEEKRLKKSTLVNIKRAADALDRHFGKDRRLKTIRPYTETPGSGESDGEKFRRWLFKHGRVKTNGPLAPTTASRMCRRAREIFDAARKRGWMRDNPLAEERDWVDVNPERDEYIQRDAFESVMAESAPDTRLFFSLIRYGGLRGVSEIIPLQWQWVDWNHHTLYVKAPKTEQYEGHEERFVPLSAELYRLLLEASERAVEGAKLIFFDAPATNAAWNNRLEVACRRARIAMWQKPKINLRASCEYDWLRKHPIDEVAEWMGHSPETMLKHYKRVAKQRTAQVAGSALHASIEVTSRAS